MWWSSSDWGEGAKQHHEHLDRSTVEDDRNFLFSFVKMKALNIRIVKVCERALPDLPNCFWSTWNDQFLPHHQEQPSKGGLEQCTSFVVRSDLISSSPHEEVLQWSHHQKRAWWQVSICLEVNCPRFFNFKANWKWAFKLFRPDLMLNIDEYVSLSWTRILWRFVIMPE